jgi:hypothetical protein
MKDDVALNGISSEQAARELRELVDSWTDDERKKQMQLDGVAYTIDWYVAGGLSDAQVREQARDLAKAASKFARELKRSKPFWRFMEHHAPEREREWFEGRKEMPWLPGFEETVTCAAFVEKAATSMAKALHRKTRVADEYERGLGIGLASAFQTLKGQPPGVSGAGDSDDPRSHYGKFVRLALLASPHSDSKRVRKIEKALPSFIKRSARFFDDSPFRKLLGDEPRE